MSRNQDRISRRDWTKLSAAGVLGAAGANWMIPNLAKAAGERGERPKACIMMFMHGGPSQHHTFNVPQKYNDDTPKTIKTAVPGVEIAEHYPRLAETMGEIALLRSMATEISNHHLAQVLMHTGYVPSNTNPRPSIGNLMAAQGGDPRAELPDYIQIYVKGNSLAGGSPIRSKPVYLGAENSMVEIRDPLKGLDFVTPVIELNELDRAAALTRGLNQRLAQDYAINAAAAAQRASYEKALTLLHSNKMKAFNLEQEPTSVRESYGQTDFGNSCLLARRLVEVGVPFVEIYEHGCDDHGGTAGRSKSRAGYQDGAIATLISDLKDRGLLDSTLIVWLGEFGRTPGTETKRPGVGHYGKAWTTLMAGGGVRGGQVIGKTDETGAEVTDRPISAQEFLATICHSMGLDYKRQYTSPDGRPMSFLDPTAEPVNELF